MHVDGPLFTTDRKRAFPMPIKRRKSVVKDLLDNKKSGSPTEINRTREYHLKLQIVTISPDTNKSPEEEKVTRSSPKFGPALSPAATESPSPKSATTMMSIEEVPSPVFSRRKSYSYALPDIRSSTPVRRRFSISCPPVHNQSSTSPRALSKESSKTNKRNSFSSSYEFVPYSSGSSPFPCLASGSVKLSPVTDSNDYDDIFY